MLQVFETWPPHYPKVDRASWEILTRVLSSVMDQTDPDDLSSQHRAFLAGWVGALGCILDPPGHDAEMVNLGEWTETGWNFLEQLRGGRQN